MKNENIYIFDFDGVFVDSLQTCLDIVKSYNPALTQEDIKSLFMGNLFTNLESGKIAKEPKGFDFQSLYKPRLLKLKPFEGAVEFLFRLNRNNNYIVSSTRSDSIKEFFIQNKMDDFFLNILGCDVGKSKIDKFQSIIDATPNNKHIFITDTVGDIIEGEHFNLHTIAVSWGYHEKARLEKSNPKQIVDNYDELLYALNNV